MMTAFFQIPFLSILLIACLFTSLICIYLKFSKTRTYKTLNYVYMFTFIYYNLLSISVLFSPSVRYSNEHIDINFFQMIPFKSISNFISNGNHVQILAGIIITIPLAPLVYLNFKKTSIPKVSLITFVIVLLIEPVQFVINVLTRYPNKIIDIDDFILNIIGWGISICSIKVLEKCSNNLQ